MNLDEAQKKKVTAWIADGLKVSEIQKRLDAELGLRLTYMQVKLLLDDLRLMPKDQPPPTVEKQIGGPPVAAKPAGSSGQKAAQTPPSPKIPAPDTVPGPGKISVNVDAVTQPGTLASGSVTFSDGNSA